MKRAIEKAIGNKAELVQIINDNGRTIFWELYDVDIYDLEPHNIILAIKYLTETNKLYKEQPNHLELNFFNIVFNTDFIDKLVSNKDVCVNCGTQIEPYPSAPALMWCPECIRLLYDELESIKPAEYHRAQLSNMPLKDMVEYINNLAPEKPSDQK
jgi:hypothetical protein